MDLRSCAASPRKSVFETVGLDFRRPRNNLDQYPRSIRFVVHVCIQFSNS